jgi:hypothetical protein
LQDGDILHFSVAIFPDDPRAISQADGSLPVMSYWYGKVAQIYLKQRTGTHVSLFKDLRVIIHSCCLMKDVWLEIQWYYRRVDLEDVGVE